MEGARNFKTALVQLGTFAFLSLPLAITVALSCSLSLSQAMPIATTTGIVSDRSAEVKELPLSELSREAASYLASREGAMGVAVVVPEQNTIFTSNGDSLFHTASVFKVVIMAAVMDAAFAEERELTPEELVLLDPMITLSDNDSATLLWFHLGGASGIQEFLDRRGVRGLYPDPDDYWGASLASAKGLAGLVSRIVWGDMLDPIARGRALQYLEEVVTDQAWSLTAALPQSIRRGPRLGIKDGWYPEEDGWWVNRVGYVLGDGERPSYAFAILANAQQSQEYGSETIAELHRLIHKALYGDSD